MFATEMSNVTDLWLSGVFFQALNTPKFVFGTPPPHSIPPRRIQRLDLGASVVRPPTQIPGYAYVNAQVRVF